MTESRREQIIADAVARWSDRPRFARDLSAIGLGLCGIVVVILVGAGLSSSEGGDIVVPAAIVAFLGFGCALGFLTGRARVKRIVAHPLFSALRASPPQIESVEPIDVVAPGGTWYGVDIRPRGYGTCTLYLDPVMRRELLEWLRPSSFGQSVGRSA
jgi:hypothetical protein